MSRKKKVKKYIVKWSLDVVHRSGEIDVDSEDVEGMSEDERHEFFQRCVDEEVHDQGPFGIVDSVDEVQEQESTMSRKVVKSTDGQVRRL